MPVLTRSAKKRQAEAQANAGQALASDNTIIEITVSATGQGTHIRWIRPAKQPGEAEEVISPDLNNDPRFKTPAPADPPTSPPKLQRRPLYPRTPVQTPFGDKVRLNFEKVEVDQILLKASGKNLYDEFSRFVGNNGAPVPTCHDLGSPLFNGGRESHWMSGFNARLHGLETPSPPEELEEGVSQTNAGGQIQTPTVRLRRALGPHGTILLGEDGEPLFLECRDEN